MKCYLLPALLLFITIIKNYAQASVHLEESERSLRKIANIQPNRSASDQNKANRMPYFFEDWSRGDVTCINSAKDTFSATALMNIDLLRQMLAIQFPDGAVGYITPQQVQQLFIQEKLYRRHEFRILLESQVEGNQMNQPVFYQVLHDGKFTLLKRVHKRVLNQYALQLASASSGEGSEVITTVTYWLKKPDQSYEKISLKRKSLEKALPEMEDKIRDLVKGHQLILYEEKDVLRLLEFLEVS